MKTNQSGKKYLAATILVFMIFTAFQPGMPELTWEPVYSFDKCNVFMMEFYAKNNELMKTSEVRTYYQSDGENFLVKFVTQNAANSLETIIDKRNEVAIQVFGAGSTTPMYNAGGYRYPAPEELKKLDLIPTDESKQIAGYSCQKYTYTYKKIFGEVWLTDQISLPNDVGVFRACKMAALHNTLSVQGFVMEMTTEDAKGGKTLMKTVSLNVDENYLVDLKNVEVTVAVNKVNYFAF